MANVYILKDIYNDRLVAAKTPKNQQDNFSREARLWLGLGYHPNIVRAHTVHNINFRPFLFMDYIGASDGSSYLLKDALSVSQNKTLFLIKTGIDILNALIYARAIFPGFVHRDLKPDNIFVDGNENILVSDFGIGHLPHHNLHIAQAHQIKQPNLVKGSTYYTEAGSFVGTLGYAAPEQYLDSSSVTYKADMYSLGIILFETLNGYLPYSPKLILEEGFHAMKVPLKMPTHLNSALQINLWQIITKMLTFNPSSRYDSFEAVKQKLEALTKEIPRDNDFISYESVKNTKKINEVALVNRTHSLIELEENDLAVSTLIEYQKSFPFSFKTPLLIHHLFNKFHLKINGYVFRRIVIADIFNPLRFIYFLIVAFCVLLTMDLSVSLFKMPMSQYSMGICLLIIMLIEKYVNKRTSITLDKITFPCLGLGLLLTILLSFLKLPSLSGGIIYSFAGASIGLVIPLVLAIVYEKLRGYEGLGGGTIKLLSMIGGWLGFLIIPVLLISALIVLTQLLFLFIINKLPGELKWSGNTISPKILKQGRIGISTSAAIFFATWLSILIPFHNIMLRILT